MKRWKTILAQALLIGCATGLALWQEVYLAGTIAIAILGALAMWATARPEALRSPFWNSAERVAAWACSLFAFVTLLACGTKAWPDWIVFLATQVGFGSVVQNEPSWATVGFWWLLSIVWLTAAALLPASRGETAGQGNWKGPAAAWICFGGGCWLAETYLENRLALFYVGLLISIVLLVLCKRWFPMKDWGIVAVNTAILMFAFLPVADLFVRPFHHRMSYFEAGKPYYSYEVASKDWRAYQCWYEFIEDDWRRMQREISAPDPMRQLPFVVVPGSSNQLFHSQIRINSLGFRGKEITQPKGDAFRIVALGESTTFGMTLNAQDRPWPEVLEDMIRERLKPQRPVEVVNAGLPIYTVEHSLFRLPRQILPLNPDLILCYHGVNGFHLLDSALPPISDPYPPLYVERPSHLLANLEHHLRIFCFNQRRANQVALHPPTFTKIMQTRYAQAYRGIINICKTNGIPLVMATYSMSVNSRTDPEVANFYRPAFRELPFQVKANEAHTALIKQLALDCPTFTLVDTQPRLDGQHAKFTDLFHLTQEGRQEMAESFFEGIKDLVQKECAGPQSAPVESSTAAAPR